MFVLLGRKGVIDIKEVVRTDLQEGPLELFFVLVLSDFKLLS